MTRTFSIRTGGEHSFHLDLERELNDAQRAAATCGNGPKLVIAGAGSGKTRTITYRVAFLMMSGVQPAQILLATFTNKAAREMLSRVDGLTGGSAGKVWGGTFHAIGNRLLRQYAKLVGLAPNYSILDEGDQRDLIKIAVTDTKVKVEEKRFPSPAVIRERLAADNSTGSRRPQLTPAGSLDEIEQVLRERSPIYAGCADHTLPTDGKTPAEIKQADRINDRAVGEMMYQVFARHFKLPDKPDLRSAFYYFIEITDLIFMLSVIEHDEITPAMLLEAKRAGTGYLAHYLEGVVPI